MISKKVPSHISQEERVRLGKLITVLQDDPAGAKKNLRLNTLDKDKGMLGYVVGVTGVAGVGKSTFIRGIAKYLRRGNLRVVVLAIDPTSSKTGWAILGDRLCMRDEELDEDPGFFIRGIASRGAGFSLAPALAETIRAAQIFADIVIVETIGSGQADIEIHRLVNTLVLLLAPLGNRVTTEKAGQTEYAHIVVLNIRKGFVQNRRFLAEASAALNGELENGWERKVLGVDAKFQTGTDKFVEELFRHQDLLKNKKGVNNVRHN